MTKRDADKLSSVIEWMDERISEHRDSWDTEEEKQWIDVQMALIEVLEANGFICELEWLSP